MKDSAYKISLDIHEHASQAALKAKKADTGRKLHITLRAGGTPYTIEDNCYAVFKATKPDNTILFNACTIENNEIIYEFTEQTCASVGRLRCEIALYGLDDKLITSPCFTLLVDGLIYPDEHVESTDEFSALTKLISDTLEATDSARQATGNAEGAAESASTASENAIQATLSANMATSQASQAAQNARTASENANNATGRANDATNAANNATNNANKAAQNANETTADLVHIVKNAMAIGKVKGITLSMEDAVELGLVGCRIFGKTTQDGTPTPDAPVDLVSVGDNGSITVNVAGKNRSQSMTVATPNGLPGIPVASGGNYTDANGQQWICDEIDLAMGVYVQRISEIVMDETTFINVGEHTNGQRYCSTAIPGIIKLDAPGSKMLLSDRYETTGWTNLNNKMYSIGGAVIITDNRFIDIDTTNSILGSERPKVVYALATPIETPLSEEELAAYAALYTYRDNTTVSNDAGAYMKLEYVMDAKKYIDSLVVSGGAAPARITNVTLISSAWKTEAENLHSQVVAISGVTPYSKVDLLPSVEQLAIFHNKDVAFVTENEDGVVTVFAIGDKPTQNYTMQAQLTEVKV